MVGEAAVDLAEAVTLAHRFKKPKDFKGTLKRLIRYLKPHTLKLIMVLIFAIASTSFTIAAPKIMSKAMNKIQDAYMAKMMLQKMSDAQKIAVNQANLQMKQLQKSPNAPANLPQQQEKVNPETAKAIQEFMKLPMLDTVKNADQKADIVQKMLDLSKNMPAQAQSGAKNVKLTKDQINGAVRAIRETNGEYNFHYIGTIALTLLGMYVISACFSLVMGLVMSGVAQKTVRDLRREVDQKIAKLPLKYFDNHPHGDILSRVTNDLDTVAQNLQQSLTQLITSLITIIGYIIMMLTISPILTLIMLATLPLYAFQRPLLPKSLKNILLPSRKSWGTSAGMWKKCIRGIKLSRHSGVKRIRLSVLMRLIKIYIAQGGKRNLSPG